MHPTGVSGISPVVGRFDPACVSSGLSHGCARTHAAGFFQWLRLLVVAIALTWPALALAQSREEQISAVLQAIDSLDMPLMRAEVMPAQVRSHVRGELKNMGSRFGLGAEWQPGNPYWDRAEAALQKDLQAAVSPQASPDQQAHAKLRKNLEALDASQIEELLRFYRSDLLRKATYKADATFATLAFALSFGTAEPDDENKKRFERLQREVARYQLTPDEERQLEQAMKSPAVQAVMRANGGSAFGTAGGLSATFKPRAKRDTINAVVLEIEEFKKRHRHTNP